MITIQPIGATDLESARAQEAFAIYRRTIGAGMQTPLEQIGHWLTAAEPGHLNCLSVHAHDRVVGYVQYSYSPAAEVLLFEYLCLDTANLPQPLGRQTMTVVRDHLLAHYPLRTTVALEVADDGAAAAARMAFFSRHGFRRCPYPYLCPSHQTDADDGTVAELMAWMPESNAAMPPDRYLELVRHIYSDRYLRWERPFLDDDQFARRQRHVDALYDAVRRSTLAARICG